MLTVSKKQELKGGKTLHPIALRNDLYYKMQTGRDRTPVLFLSLHDMRGVGVPLLRQRGYVPFMREVWSRGVSERFAQRALTLGGQII